MSDYRTTCNMDADDIMDSLSESEEVEFVRDCYDYLDVFKQQEFIEKLGAEEIVNLLDEEIVEYLDDNDMIEELIERGYKITKDGSEDI